VSEALRRVGTSATAPAAPDDGPLAAEDAIALGHRAGGRIFLAHPLCLRSDPAQVKEILSELRAFGLDGVEALYAPAPPEACEALVRAAEDLGLLVCAGTDYHGPQGALTTGLGVEMPKALWQRFRDALRLEAATSSASTAVAYTRARRPFGLNVIVPTLLAVALFVGTIWALLIPSFERALLERKREMIRELTHSAWSIMNEAERQVQAGKLTREQAQADARDRIASLRYGRENKDYFWLQDMHPRMVMHPYRSDLDSQDLTDFRDAAGARIFVEFADMVRRHKEGLIDYVWQWPDDPRRLEPKESFVKGFEPWGWVVGTGLYMEDVRDEIARLERGLVQAALAITALVALLLVHVARHSRRLDLERCAAVEELHAATERYRSLVEATTEGTLLVLNGRCRYANPHLLVMLGYTAAELELLDLTEVLPQNEANAEVWARIEALQRVRETAVGGVSGELRRCDGGSAACTLVPSRIAFGGRGGIVLLARETGGLMAGGAPRTAASALAEAVAHLPAGVFRARADRPGTLVEANAIGERCLTAAAGDTGEGVVTLSDVFRDAADFSAFTERLRRDGTAEHRLAATPFAGSATVFALRATLERDSAGRPVAINGLVEDVTSLVQREHERDAMLERLQSSLLFLHEPVSRVLPSGLFCPGDWPVRKVAALLAEGGATVALVRDASGDVIGIVTASDLCERVVAAGLDARTPVRAVMSAPVATVPESTPVCEALLRMQERHLRHLAVIDGGGRMLGTLSDRDLLPFQQFGAIVLTTEISRAALVEDVVLSCRRVSATVKALLDSGAHPRNVTAMVASVCDAATERFVHLAIEELGPPPVRFAFVALGSQGRQEQTLITDQDNAIIYAPAEQQARVPETAAYFLELGRRVCGWLNEAGYPFCRGRFMAQNAVWTRDLPAWKTHFSYWAARAEPDELLKFTVFYDFRAVCGDAGLIDELRQHVFSELRDAPAFFPHFARDALLFKPPIMLLGRIWMGGARGGLLNLKSAMLPIIAFARLYALRHGIAETNTLDRLDALTEIGQLSPASRDEIVSTYTFLMRLRLRCQVQGYHAGRVPDNLVEVRRLGYADRTLLRQAFAHIRVLQRRIDFDFLGGTHA
jgi:PAS domain S-box-containing protein